MIQRGKSSIPTNHSPRINALAKTASLPPSNTCRHLLCCRDLACDCKTKPQTSAPHSSRRWKSFRHSHYVSQQQPKNFFCSQFSLNGIHSLRVSKGFGKTHPSFTLYLLEKLCVTGEAAAAPKGGTGKQLSCTTHPPARQGEVKARP